MLHETARETTTAGASGWRQLDTARLILAAVVVASHAYYFFLTPLGYVLFASVAEWMARYAVLCFFVISGLVIGRSLTARRDGFVPFMIRRVGRIYPPLIASVVLVVTIGHALRWAGVSPAPLADAGPMVNSFSYDLGSTALSLATFGFCGKLASGANIALWSLVIEMRCYVVAGLLAQAILSRTPGGKMISAILLCGALALLVTDPMFDSVIAICYAAFAFGLMLSLAVEQIPRLLPEVRVDISYSLYILHQPVMLGLVLACYRPFFPSLANAISLGLAASGVAVTLAWLSARWIEPFRLRPLAKAYDSLVRTFLANVGSAAASAIK
ncbi:acyltransferase family protein [Bradyrhizobium sp.]|uniref:acyltransferase family protein n=1 Tax=Bradyrhizobium sp. TaxID=376 RepID=UPI002D6E42CA|nr:acyltransferase family protein [Bradyrhizobium sp.]HZR75246.1 acyltransferase family protein [Bradyrhizobium sp.]